jgi:hypothetical protein
MTNKGEVIQMGAERSRFWLMTSLAAVQKFSRHGATCLIFINQSVVDAAAAVNLLTNL